MRIQVWHVIKSVFKAPVSFLLQPMGQRAEGKQLREISRCKAETQVHAEVAPSPRASRSLTRRSLFVFHLASNLAWQLLCYEQLKPWRHVCSSHCCNSAITHRPLPKKRVWRLRRDIVATCAVRFCDVVKCEKILNSDDNEWPILDSLHLAYELRQTKWSSLLYTKPFQNLAQTST